MRSSRVLPAALLAACLVGTSCGDPADRGGAALDQTTTMATGDPSTTPPGGSPSTTVAPDDRSTTMVEDPNTTTTHAPRPERAGARAELDAARARWIAAGLDDYAVTYRLACFCWSGTWRLHVEHGTVRLADPILTDTNRATGALPDYVGFDPTVAGTFATVERALSEADAVTVSYDATYGYPNSVDIDWIENAVDDEESIALTDLQPETLPSLTAVQLKAREAFLAASARWNNSPIPDYGFHLTIGCACPSNGGYAVRVANRFDVTVTADDGSTRQAGDPGPTVDRLFREIGRTFVTPPGGDVDARYDSVHGYPTYVQLLPAPQAADSDIVYTLTDFIALQPH